MRMYETVMILHPEVTDDKIVSVLGKVEGVIQQAGGKVAEVDQWGVRRLAYKIAKQSKGYYTVVKFATNPNIINELERTLTLVDDCIRFMTVNLEEEVSAEQLSAIQKVHKKSAVASDDHGESEPRTEDEAPAAPAAAAAPAPAAPAPVAPAAPMEEPAPVVTEDKKEAGE